MIIKKIDRFNKQELVRNNFKIHYADTFKML